MVFFKSLTKISGFTLYMTYVFLRRFPVISIAILTIFFPPFKVTTNSKRYHPTFSFIFSHQLSHGRLFLYVKLSTLRKNTYKATVGSLIVIFSLFSYIAITCFPMTQALHTSILVVLRWWKFGNSFSSFTDGMLSKFTW